MKHITVAALKQLLQQPNDVFLVDVREPSEHTEFSIGGALMPLGEILQHAPGIPANRMVVVYCKRGIRSQLAIQRLEAKFGLGNLHNLSGGMEAWKKENNG